MSLRSAVVGQFRKPQGPLGQLASLAEFAAELQGFDRILSLNVVQFLPDMGQGFRQIHRCLAEHGRAVTTFQPRSSRPTRAQALDMARRIEAAMLETGYDEIERHELPLEPVPAICVSGVKSVGSVGGDAVKTRPLPRP